jgi:hypothetical protein
MTEPLHCEHGLFRECRECPPRFCDEHGTWLAVCPHSGASAVDYDSWAPVDLGPYLRGEITRPAPTVGLHRSDGLQMLYGGKEHAVIGEMESGKSWFSIACAVDELERGHPVLYLHFEESDPTDTIERLLALGVRPHVIEKLFRFVAPERQVSADALQCLLDPKPSLVIFDGVNEAMSLHRWGIREEDGAAQFRAHLVKPCTRAGAATLSCDHVVKDVERRGRNAIGSIHKGNGLSGSLILLENAEPFGRLARGRSHVFITKDRPGHLRQHGRISKTPGKTFMGELVVDDSQVYGPDLELKFWAPRPPEPAKDFADMVPVSLEDEVFAKVVEIIAAGKVANLRTIRAMVPFRVSDVDDALSRLVFRDRLAETPGARNSRVFTVSGDQSSESVQ